MGRIFISLIVFSILVGQSNPIDVGTAGARQLRVNGQVNIAHNPATLGYFATAKELDSLNFLEDSLETIISDSGIVIKEKIIKSDSLEINMSGFQITEIDDFKISEEDSLFNTDQEIKSDDLISLKPSKKYPKFSISLLNLSFGFRSSILTPNWINDQLFGNRDLRDQQQLNKFLDGISEDLDVQIPLASSVLLLNINFGSSLISLGQIQSHTSIKLPSDITQIPFKGLPRGEELDLSGLDINHITYLPITYSKGFVLQPGIVPFGRKSYAGIRAKALIGLLEMNTKDVSGILIGTAGNTLIDMELEINNNLLNNKPNFGFGLGLDLGIITEIDEEISVGASIDNLIGSIYWNTAMIYSASIYGEITPKEISEADSLSDLIEQSELKETGSYKTRLPVSINFSGTYAAKEWVNLDANFRLDLGNTYWASDKPTIAIGSEFFPDSKIPLYLGMSLGGHSGFAWGMGLSIKTGPVIIDMAGGQDGGFFNNATGIRAGFSLRVER